MLDEPFDPRYGPRRVAERHSCCLDGEEVVEGYCVDVFPQLGVHIDDFQHFVPWVLPDPAAELPD